MNPLLDVHGLRTGFGPHAVLHGVDFEVREGEIAAILGLNGAGKSVTMRTVAGIQPAWDGSISLAGEDLTPLSVEERVGAGLGHVTQGRQVFPDLTVEENLRLGGYLMRRRDRARYAQSAAGLFERFPRLAERRKQLAGTMSGGEQAMLAVARALVSQPKLLLVDEPSAGLAPAIVDELFDLLRQVNADGVTILLVEQNVSFAVEVADTVHIMQRGTIVHSSEVASLDRDALVRHLGIGPLLADTVGAGADS